MCLGTATVLCKVVLRMPFAIMRAADESKRYAGWSLARNALGMVLAVALVAGLHLGATGVVLSQFLAELVFLLPADGHDLPLAARGLPLEGHQGAAAVRPAVRPGRRRLVHPRPDQPMVSEALLLDQRRRHLLARLSLRRDPHLRGNGVPALVAAVPVPQPQGARRAEALRRHDGVLPGADALPVAGSCGVRPPSCCASWRPPSSSPPRR